MTMRAMCCVSRSPMLLHVAPPSVDLYTPSPQYALRVRELSPVPTQTTLPFDGATATAPTEAIPAASVTGSHVVPLLTLRHTPPVRAPANTVCRSAWAGVSGTASELTHAPARHGPRFRYGNPLRMSAKVRSAA